VLDLLRFLEARGFRGAPTVIEPGFDAEGHETVSFVPGSSPHELLSELLLVHLRERMPDGDTRVPIDAMVEFAVSALIGLAAWRLESELPYTTEEIDGIYRALTEPGTRAGLCPAT
jgi:hypothetical protein